MIFDFVMKLGWVVGVVLVVDGIKEVLVGKDICVSGYMLEFVLEVGLLVVGVNIVLVGFIFILVVVYLVLIFRVDVGVVISVFYNLYYDNGIKFFGCSGVKLGSE